MKRIFALILCLCMVLAGCGGAAPAETETVPPTTQTEATENPNLKIFEAAKTELENRLGASDGFCYSSVNYDDENFTVSVSMTGIVDLVNEALARGIKSDNEQWQSLRNSTITGYEMIKKVLDEAGADLTDVKVNFDLVSDLDTENVLVSAVNGSIFYDVIETMEKMVDSGIVETEPMETESAETNNTLLLIVKGTMLKNHSDVEVKQDGSTVVASFTYQGLGQGVPYITKENKELLDTWNNLIEASEKESQSLCDLVKACGYDYSVKMIILNDLDTSKSLLEFTDGKLTYNVADAN